MAEGARRDAQLTSPGKLRTWTFKEQRSTEYLCRRFLRAFHEVPDLERFVKLERDLHIAYLKRTLLSPGSFGVYYSSSQPWLLFWCLQPLDLMNSIPSTFTREDLLMFLNVLKRCYHQDTAAFSGSRYIGPNVVMTFAAYNVLAILSQYLDPEEVFGWIDPERFLGFLREVKRPDGSFGTRREGESDVRTTYCAVSVASQLGLVEKNSEFFSDAKEYVRKCQTYEGGITNIPFGEAHGGYTFCGLATLDILGGMESIDLERVEYWLVRRQMRFEGGFCGRTNKLVDACYSHWQGSCFPILQKYRPSARMNERALQQYVLTCCQNTVTGGLRDKPGTDPDVYHTCFALCGLSSSQRNGFVLGDPANKLREMATEHILTIEAQRNISKFFQKVIKE